MEVVKRRRASGVEPRLKIEQRIRDFIGDRQSYKDAGQPRLLLLTLGIGNRSGLRDRRPVKGPWADEAEAAFHF